MTPRSLFIITKARSGSNQLASYVNQVPGCRCYGEIFKPGFPKNRKGWPGIARRLGSVDEALALHRDDLCAFWDRLVESHRGENQIVGARIFYDDRRSTPIWDTRVFRPESLVVHLWRDAVFDSYVSLLRARAADQWVRQKGDSVDSTAGDRLHFDAEEYKAYRDQARRRFARTEARLRDLPHALSVEYAQIARPDLLSRRLAGFLGQAVSLRQTHQKLTTRPPVSYIANAEAAAPFVDDRLSVVQHA